MDFFTHEELTAINAALILYRADLDVTEITPENGYDARLQKELIQAAQSAQEKTGAALRDGLATPQQMWSALQAAIEVFVEEEKNFGSVDEIRDNGPYSDADQALKQFANWSRGMPMSSTEAAIVLLSELTLLTKQPRLTSFERSYVEAHGVDPILAQIIARLVIQATLAASPPAIER